MNWQEILTIIIPILLGLGGGLGWIYSRLDKKFDKVDQRFDNTDKRFDSILGEIREMRKDIQSLDSRVSRIEGFLVGIHPYELKVVNKEENKK
jgi:hypothetical protein